MITVLSSSSVELDILGSRFLGFARSIASLEEAESVISSFKDNYHDATHVCYAFRYGANEKCSDDGEPGKSAGFPLLSLLRNDNVDRTILVVVRYFGGSKLGLPRLRRTYRDTGELALKEAAFAEIVEGKRFEVSLSYSDYDSFIRRSKNMEVESEKPLFQEEVRFFLRGDGKIMGSVREMLPVGSILNEETIEIKRRIGK